MGYPVSLALRYLRSKKRAFVSVGTAFAMLGVTLGVAALSIVMSVTGGFQEQFREKVLGVNAHVLVLKYSIDFREYRDVMKRVEHVPGVIGVAPFVINPMMVTHGDRTATGVLLKGVDPELMPGVLDLPKHIVEGNLEGLRRADAKPPERAVDPFRKGDEGAKGVRRGSSSADGAGDGGIVDEGGQAESEEGVKSRRSLLQAVADSIAEDEARADAGVAKSPVPSDAPSDFDAAPVNAKPAKGGPIGDVTPTGGFKSRLPDDDLLPEVIDPDPCRSPDLVAKMPGVVLGRTLGKQLGVGIHDCVQITSPTIGLSFGGSGGRPPIAKQFRVIAIFDAGFDQYDSKLVYTDLYEAQAFYEQGDSVTGVEMKVDNIDDAGAISHAIEQLLANSIYHTMDWQELNHGLFTALLIQKILMSFVLALIIVVAAFTVIATLIMIVLDKKKEIAVLKAIGAHDSAILRVFLYHGGIIGLVGTSTGLAIGFVCCKLLDAYGFPLDPKVYFISRLPVDVRFVEFGMTGGIAIAICLVATVFPALYAAWMRPAEGLRSE